MANIFLDDKHFFKSNHFMKAHLKHILKWGLVFNLYYPKHNYIEWSFLLDEEYGIVDGVNLKIYFNKKCNGQEPSFSFMQNFVLPKEQKCVSEER